MIIGAHVIIYSRDAEADRTFMRDVLAFDAVDAGDGWLIFALPPAELAVHPEVGGGRHELYLMCDDIDATVADLGRRGTKISSPVTEPRWGRMVRIELPGGGELGLYQPKHPTAARTLQKPDPATTDL
jgi:catechol 2,3-dioxygenase-like lactoylglutathione lyase family enzyme